MIEWETALGAGGALEAAIEAREEGLVRFIGVTGHGLSVPEMHRRSLERFAVRLGAVPVQLRPDAGRALRRDVRDAGDALRGAQRRAADDQEPRVAPLGGPRRRPPSTWYEPLREQADIDLAAHWVLGDPQVFLLTTGDVEILPMLLDAAERFEKRPSDEQMDELTRRADLAPLFV